MKIIGIDPGTGITGFGVIGWHQQQSKLLDAGVIRTKAHTPQGERLQIIYEGMLEIMSEHKPDALAIEKLFFNSNITTAMTVSEARGVVLLAAQQKGLPIAEYTPLQIKMAVTGYGKAEKSQVQEMVKTILKLKSIPKPDDAADGLAVALTHAFST